VKSLLSRKITEVQATMVENPSSLNVLREKKCLSRRELPFADKLSLHGWYYRPWDFDLNNAHRGINIPEVTLLIKIKHLTGSKRLGF